MSSSPRDPKRPLVNGESELVTVGCRHSNPDICAKNSMPGVCAFVSREKLCHSPPASWKKLYKKLLEEK